MQISLNFSDCNSSLEIKTEGRTAYGISDKVTSLSVNNTDSMICLVLWEYDLSNNLEVSLNVRQACSAGTVYSWVVLPIKPSSIWWRKDESGKW